MRNRRVLVAALAAAALALVCPQLALARITRHGAGTAVVCGTTPTPLDDTSVPNTFVRDVLVQNPYGNLPIYIGGQSGGQTVTVAGGIELRGDRAYSPGEPLDADVQLYCIVASGTVTVRVVESL